jgi:hypothetical protein
MAAELHCGPQADRRGVMQMGRDVRPDAPDMVPGPHNVSPGRARKRRDHSVGRRWARRQH